MGFLFLAVCVAAVLAAEGTLRTIAIVVAGLNGLALVYQMAQEGRGEPADATTALHFLTTIAGLGLLIYALAA